MNSDTNVTLLADEVGVYVRQCGITERYLDRCQNPGVNVEIAHFLLVRSGYSLDRVRIADEDPFAAQRVDFDGSARFAFLPQFEKRTDLIPGGGKFMHHVEEYEMCCFN